MGSFEDEGLQLVGRKVSIKAGREQKEDTLKSTSSAIVGGFGVEESRFRKVVVDDNALNVEKGREGTQVDDITKLDTKPLKKVPSTLEDHVEKVISKVNESNVGAESETGGSSGSSSSSSSSTSSQGAREQEKKDELIDLGDFVVLELIRMQRISRVEFEFLRKKFQMLDGIIYTLSLFLP